MVISNEYKVDAHDGFSCNQHGEVESVPDMRRKARGIRLARAESDRDGWQRYNSYDTQIDMY